VKRGYGDTPKEQIRLHTLVGLVTRSLSTPVLLNTNLSHAAPISCVPLETPAHLVSTRNSVVLLEAGVTD
jgi:muramoyltetrapeptide carboxypeptidase LdcA involved in peptidoglycan recycling